MALKSLTSKWRKVVQQILPDLWSETPEPRPTLTELIDHFQLDHTMIGYHANDETFG
jgi:hypothetical protein